LETLAINIELHCLPARHMEALIDKLREHAGREERGVYRWMTQGRATGVAPAA
jgi:hypothetical protein